MYREYIKPLQNAGENVGVEAAQSVGADSTQTTLNAFHSAGSHQLIPVASGQFENLINATKEPHNQVCYLYFTENNKSIKELREMIGKELIEITL